jgi:hypothetical protein
MESILDSYTKGGVFVKQLHSKTLFYERFLDDGLHQLRTRSNLSAAQRT